MPTITGTALNPDSTASPGVRFERLSSTVTDTTTVTRRPIRATPDADDGTFSVSLLPGIYRYYPDEAASYYVSVEVGDTGSDVSELVTETSSPVALITYFATLTAAKAYTRFVDARMYAIASSASFPGGQFHYDEDSAASADNVDTIALDTAAGRLIRFA